jgi:hypothetical protein
MKALGSAAVTALILAATAANGAVAHGAETPKAAVWSSHALIVDLRNLPKRYTCNDLGYKFRDVLLTIGARPDMKILTYRCERRLGAIAYSPRVQLEFSTLREVSGREVRWADTQVVTKAIRLEPGAPSHLDDQDCALLDQMKSTLLKHIGVTVTVFHLACQAPPVSALAAKPPFGLTVEALVPVSESLSHVARVPPADQGGSAGSGS